MADAGSSTTRWLVVPARDPLAVFAHMAGYAIITGVGAMMNVICLVLLHVSS
jgi:hypothetical protein